MHLIKRYGHASKFLIFWKDHCFPWSNFSFLESEKTACYYLHLFIFKIHLILSLYMQTIKLSSYMYARRENLNHWIKNMPCVDPLYVSQQYIVNTSWHYEYKRWVTVNVAKTWRYHHLHHNKTLLFF